MNDGSAVRSGTSGPIDAVGAGDGLRRAGDGHRHDGCKAQRRQGERNSVFHFAGNLDWKQISGSVAVERYAIRS
jgi:hypothetical protein